MTMTSVIAMATRNFKAQIMWSVCMDIGLVRRHSVSVAIGVFLVVYIGIVMCRPSFLYNRDGSLREFGLAQSRKTVTPAWLLAIVLAIACYFAVRQTTGIHAVM